MYTVPFYGLALYTYYHGIIQHSGINFMARWWQPWQPDSIFHDNHHQYCHVNFGFNCYAWDEVTFKQSPIKKYWSFLNNFAGFPFFILDPRLREETGPLLQRTNGRLGFGPAVGGPAGQRSAPGNPRKGSREPEGLPGQRKPLLIARIGRIDDYG